MTRTRQALVTLSVAVFAMMSCQAVGFASSQQGHLAATYSFNPGGGPKCCPGG
jgi:hypothetical protein